MRRGSRLLLAVFLVALVMSAGCKRSDSPDLSKLGPSSAATSTVLPVGSPLCPGGGIGIYTGSDGNGNGVLDATEILKGAPICGPVPDEEKPGEGLLSLVMIASEPSSTMHCPAGGLKVLSGPDGNRNNVLDASEVAFTEYLCNGTPGASSAAGITVAVAPPVPAPPVDKKKGKKAAPAKKPAAAAGKAPAKARNKEAQAAQADAPAKNNGEEAGPAQEEKKAPVKPAAAPKKSKEKPAPAAASKEKSGSVKQAAVPQGWNNVKVGSQLASVVYKIEGRYVTVRFTNLSTTSALRFKYTVRWKYNQSGTWVDDSTMEGISFRLKPEESLDREVRVQRPDIRDLVIDLDVVETS